MSTTYFCTRCAREKAEHLFVGEDGKLKRRCKPCREKIAEYMKNRPTTVEGRRNRKKKADEPKAPMDLSDLIARKRAQGHNFF